LHAADTITVNGGIATSGGDLRMIAGTGPGIDTAHALFQAPNPPVATEVADDIGLITINAPVTVGAGNMVLVTSANGQTGSNVGGLVQGAFGPLVGSGTLAAVTLRGAGGVDKGGSPIVLDQAGALGGQMNSIKVINLFACAYTGCVGPEVPTPLWEPTRS